MHVRMPAEFEPHQHTWLLWPIRADNWRCNAAHAQKAMLEFATKIAQYEPVRLGVPKCQLQSVANLLPADVFPYVIEYDDVWVRDTGPTCVLQDRIVSAIDWRFNSWGGLFDSWELDDSVPQQICSLEGIRTRSLNIILEGGAIHVDGAGTLLATEECLLSSNRNEGMTKRDYEDLFLEHLGVSRVIWIPRGIYADETGGHIDNMCAFFRTGHVLLSWCDDFHDANYDRCREAFKVLKKSKDTRGVPIEIVRLPLPEPMHMTEEESETFATSAGTISRRPGDRLGASYMNFYALNGAVIVPTFGQKSDDVAINVIQAAYPERDVIAINSREFVLGGGGPHCLTQHIPRYIA